VRRRVTAEAERRGYRRNRLVAALMTAVRQTRTPSFCGNLALIHVPSARQPSLLPTQRRIIRGARDRAAELGFKLEAFSLGSSGMSPRSLGRVLSARGIVGAIFLHADPSPDPIEFPWDQFTAVGIDYGEPEPTLHTVSLDHYLTLTHALRRLHRLGYRRIGMFLERFKDERIGGKWSAPFLAHQATTASRRIEAIPLLVVDRMNEPEFLAWHAAHRPDLVIGHVDKAVGWLRAQGVRVPAQTAFFNLNWTARTLPCAGFDVRPELQGTVAAETVIAQLQRNDRGLPADPRTIMIKGRWVDGPTLRPGRVTRSGRATPG
jgi:LacI family transcriptional regulator